MSIRISHFPIFDLLFPEGIVYHNFPVIDTNATQTLLSRLWYGRSNLLQRPHTSSMFLRREQVKFYRKSSLRHRQITYHIKHIGIGFSHLTYIVFQINSEQHTIRNPKFLCQKRISRVTSLLNRV